MDIFRIAVEGPNKDVLGETLKAGQTVRVVRYVTISYILNVSDYLDKEQETDISVKEFISRELDAMGISDVLDTEDETDDLDEQIISVEII